MDPDPEKPYAQQVEPSHEFALQFFKYRTFLTLFWIAMLLIWGWRSSLRAQRPSSAQRILKNFALGGVTELTQILLAAPVLAFLATSLLAARPTGWIPVDWPWWVRSLTGLLALDGILYLWHRLNHIIPFLWRFHRVHHSDPQMDASTAVRFHPGEFLLATGTSALQMWIVGFDPATYLLYDFGVMLAVPFHHANLRLPRGWDSALQWLIITPEIHAIHHSVRPEETNSNYGTIFSFWDRIFGSRRVRGPAADIETGVTPEAPQGAWKLLTAPVRPAPDAA